MLNWKKTGPHLLFWFLAGVFWIWFFTELTSEYRNTLVLVGIVGTISIATVYFFNAYLIPKFLFKARYGRFILFSSYTLTLAIWATLLLTFLYFTTLLTRTQGGNFPITINLVFILAGMLLVQVAGVLGHVVRENFRHMREKAELEKKALESVARLRESELRFLKSQFHPHFLFNTLNNLYALSLRKSEETPDLILKLSGLLDYSLYGSDKERVAIQEEIDFIQNYLDLIRMRFREKASINFMVQVENPDFELAPLIFMPFVENAVKHGIGKIEKGAWVDISLKQQEQKVFLCVENQVSVSPRIGNDEELHAGLGLSQVRERLQLIYRGKHHIHISESNDRYKVDLEISE